MVEIISSENKIGQQEKHAEYELVINDAPVQIAESVRGEMAAGFGRVIVRVKLIFGNV